MERERLVFVGNGLVGQRCVEEIVRRCPDRFDITVVGAEARAAYNRVLLPAIVADEVCEQDCALRPASWYDTHRVHLRLGTRVSAIDRDRRRVHLSSGERLPYDRLVLATGAQAMRPNLPGFDHPSVSGLHDLDDATRLCALRRDMRVAVIGGGVLGIEAAEALVRRGASVTLVHRGPHLMNRQVDATAARMIEEVLTQSGITLRLGIAPTELCNDGDRCGLALSNGDMIDVDHVLIALGSAPRIDLARDCGLESDLGIVVDDRLTTSDPRIHAIGDCASHRGVVHGLVEPGAAQAVILARRLSGEIDARYSGTIPTVRLKTSHIALTCIGAMARSTPEHSDIATLCDPSAQRYVRLAFDGKQLRHALLVGDISSAGLFAELIRERADISSVRDRLVFGEGPQTSPDLARAA